MWKRLGMVALAALLAVPAQGKRLLVTYREFLPNIGSLQRVYPLGPFVGARSENGWMLVQPPQGPMFDTLQTVQTLKYAEPLPGLGSAGIFVLTPYSLNLYEVADHDLATLTLRHTLNLPGGLTLDLWESSQQGSEIRLLVARGAQGVDLLSWTADQGFEVVRHWSRPAQAAAYAQGYLCLVTPEEALEVVDPATDSTVFHLGDSYTRIQQVARVPGGVAIGGMEDLQPFYALVDLRPGAGFQVTPLLQDLVISEPNHMASYDSLLVVIAAPHLSVPRLYLFHINSPVEVHTLISRPATGIADAAPLTDSLMLYARGGALYAGPFSDTLWQHTRLLAQVPGDLFRVLTPPFPSFTPAIALDRNGQIYYGARLPEDADPNEALPFWPCFYTRIPGSPLDATLLSLYGNTHLAVVSDQRRIHLFRVGTDSLYPVMTFTLPGGTPQPPLAGVVRNDSTPILYVALSPTRLGIVEFHRQNEPVQAYTLLNFGEKPGGNGGFQRVYVGYWDFPAEIKALQGLENRLTVALATGDILQYGITDSAGAVPVFETHRNAVPHQIRYRGGPGYAFSVAFDDSTVVLYQTRQSESTWHFFAPVSAHHWISTGWPANPYVMVTALGPGGYYIPYDGTYYYAHGNALDVSGLRWVAMGPQGVAYLVVGVCWPPKSNGLAQTAHPQAPVLRLPSVVHRMLRLLDLPRHSRVTVWDALGRKRYERRVSGETVIRVDRWPQGVYLLRLSTPHGAYTHRFVVVR